MYNKLNINNRSLKITTLFAFVVLFFASCDFAYELPEAGSIADETPPSAAFGHSPNEADFHIVDFSNLSSSATDYSWDFGDSNTSTDAEPSHTYAAEGTYTVSLTATDKLGQASTSTQTVEVVEIIVAFQPVILEASFEELSLPDGTGDGRDSWRNSDLGGVIQITTSPVSDGAKASKFPSAGDRIAYQLITVLPDTDYSLNFVYTMKTSPVGTLSVAVLGGAVTNPDDIAGATIQSETFSDQSSANDYVNGSVVFNSGSNTEVAIYISNVDVECRLDDVSILEL